MDVVNNLEVVFEKMELIIVGSLIMVSIGVMGNEWGSWGERKFLCVFLIFFC